MSRILAIDFDAWACKTYQANFPNARVICGRVEDHYAEIVDAHPDIVLGGPPCQGFSSAGKGLGNKDERNGWPSFIEAIRRTKPRSFLAENVPGMCNQSHLPYTQSVYRELEALGYSVDVKLLDAVNFGVPQFRERLWWWGIRRDLFDAGMKHKWPTPTHCWPPTDDHPELFGGEHRLLPAVTVGMALGLTQKRSLTQKCIDATWSPTYESDQPSRLQNASPHGLIEYHWSTAMLAKHPPASPASSVQAKYAKGGAEGLVEVPTIHRRRGSGMCERHGERLDSPVTDPMPTINSGVSRQIHLKDKLLVRRLTPAECARLQSCPDDMAWPDKITKTAQYRIIGNGWACAVAHHLRLAFDAVDPGEHSTLDLFCGGGLGALGWHHRYWSLPCP